MSNENNSKANQSNAQQKVVLGAPYGKLHIGPKLDLEEHAAMRADQLSAMLMLIHGAGLDHFASIEENSQQSYLWLAFQLSAELVEILPFMTVRTGEQA